MDKDHIRIEIERIIEARLGTNEFDRKDLIVDMVDIDGNRLDSLDTMEIVMNIEEHFSIELPDEELDHLPRISDLVELAARHIE